MPLTAAQYGMWLAQQVNPENPMYSIAECVEIPGEIDVSLFEAALRRVVDEAETLRVAFGPGPEGPVQTVVEDLDWELHTVDVSGADDPSAAAEEWMLGRVRTPVNLDTGPLFTFGLLKLAADRYTWFSRVHHTIVDGYSWSLIVSRVAVLYSALVAGEEPKPATFGTLAELVEPDADYRRSEQFTADGAYWSERLAGAAEPVTLAGRPTRVPTDHVRQAGPVTPEQAEALRDLARETRVGWPAVVVAGVAAYLHRLTGADDLVLGLAAAARPTAAAKRTPGMVSNALPVRVRPRPSDTVATFLRSVSDEIHHALRHQRYRYEDIHRDLGRVGDRKRLWGPEINLIMYGEQLAFAGHGATVRGFSVGPEEDLSLIVDNRAPNAGFLLDLHANADLYTEETVAGHREALTGFLAALAAAGPDARLDSVDAAVPAGWVPPAAADGQDAVAPAAYRAPGTPREEALCGLVAQVLKVDRVGVDDDFFELGGHSLTAIRLLGRIRDTFGAELSIRTVFETPTVAALAAHLDQAAGRSRALEPFDRPAVLPLSLTQQRLWLVNRLQGPSGAYNMGLALRLTGRLDRTALAAAFHDVLARHESLRTTFPETDGKPRQHILSPAEAAARVVLTERATDAADLDATVAEVVAEGFDLTGQLAVRPRLLVLGPEDHVLLVVLHHIVADGLSLAPLARDLGLAYTARTAGEPPAFAPLPVQYADYTLWQQSVLGDENDPDSPLARRLAHWKRALAALPEELELPVDRPRPGELSQRGDIVRFDVDAVLHRRLIELGRAHRASLFMVLQSAVAVLLSKLGAGEDIPLGSAVAGRGDAGLDDLVGCFVNTVVFRNDVSGNPSVGELIDRTREMSLSAHAHQDVPFERLVEALNPERSLARNPLFQVMMDVQTPAESHLELPGLLTTPQQVDPGVTKIDLLFGLDERSAGHEAAAGISGRLEYSTDLFDRATIEAMSARLLRVLDAFTADPGQRVADIDVLTEGERHLVLGEFGQSPLLEPELLLPALFERQAARTPGAPALTEHEATYTYAELNAAANRLAHTLIAAGAGPEQRIAVLLPRSAELVIALLAVLKSGAAYVPVDPEYPDERIAYMLADASPALILADPRTREAVPTREVPVLDVTTEHPVPSADPGDPTDGDRSRPLDPAHPAYVIYTSGSTGRPKGVVVTHRSVAVYLEYARERYPSVADGTLLHSPVSFDLTVTSLYAPLISGGPVRVTALGGVLKVPHSTHGARHAPSPHRPKTQVAPLQGPSSGTPRARTEHRGHRTGLSKHPLEGPGRAAPRPAFLKATPAHLALLGVLPEEFSPTRELVVGGEMLLGEAVEELRRHRPGITVVNEYGPTEATVGCVEFRIGPDETVPGGPLPIGRPMWNSVVRVLDQALNPVPPGVCGEIYIGGGQLARGYLNRPGLTAERFVAAPYDPPGTRMYRTGDVGRWRADGQLEYLGRVDDQIKLNGFRIELGEIEAVLARHPRVARSAATVREDVPGHRQLAGYVIPRAGETVEPAEVVAWAAGQLPAHMLPAAVVVLDTLPLTPNGKLDRKALPAPERTGGSGTEAPRTPLEEALAALFAEVLGRESVGLHDSFFELGGDSIVSIQMVARARRKGLVFSPKEVFELKTVAALAAATAEAGAPARTDENGGIGALPATPIMRWLEERGGPVDAFHQSILVQVPAGLGESELADALQAVLDRHDALRTRLDRAGGSGRWRYEITGRGSVAATGLVRRVDIAGLAGEALRTTIGGEARAAWDRLAPEAGVMVQLVWFDAGPDTPGRLLFAAHHLVVDGVSWTVLLPDLRAAWEAVAVGKKPELAPVGTPLRRWAELLDEQTAARAAESDRWARTLAVPAPTLTDRPLDPAVDTAGAARRLTRSLPADVTAALLDRAPGALNASVHEVLITALTVALVHWRGRRGLGEDAGALIDVEGHGRQEIADGLDLSRTVGWFTTIRPARLDPGVEHWDGLWAGGPEAGRVLRAVKEQLRDVPDEGIGYGLLRHLDPETGPRLAALATAPLLFNYLGRAEAPGGDWGPAPETDVVQAPGADLPLSHLLEVDAVVRQEPDGPHLTAVWTWPGRLLSEADVRELADTWFRAARALTEYAERPDAGGHTPSDLALVELSQDEIDGLEAEWRTL
ncbi:siderophore biosynthesis non-ribosomal peptide synthetase modules [Streptomyces sp. NL15-2K]|nr:siderophore biosynthesis non-ribosomal peptide synthetase modules [Streptomyces sp. NL15-2K]